jgi:hypothetical protein
MRRARQEEPTQEELEEVEARRRPDAEEGLAEDAGLRDRAEYP